MAYEVNNYGKQLANIRDRYNEVSDELRSNYQKNIKDKEKQHAKIQTDQKESFLKQKNQLEKDRAEHLEKYGRRLDQTIKEVEQNYRDNLKKEKTAHNKERSKQMRDYNERLTDISRAFETSKKDQRNNFEEFKEEQNKISKQREKNFNQKISDIYKSATDKNRNLQEVNQLEKAKLLNDNEIEKDQINRAARLSQDKLKKEHRKVTELLKENHKNDTSRMKNSKNSALETLAEAKDIQMERQKNAFNSAIQDLSKQSARRIEENNLQNERNKKQLAKELNQDIDFLKGRIRDYANKHGQAAQRRGLASTGSNQSEDRINILLNEIRTLDDLNKKKRKIFAAEQAESLNALSKEHQVKLNQEKDEIRNLYNKKIGGLKNNFEKAEQSRIIKNKILEADFENNRLAEAARNKRILEQTKKNHASVVKKINDDNLHRTEKLKEELNQKKSSAIENAKRDNYAEKAIMREKLVSQHEAVKDNLQKKIDNKEVKHQKDVRKYQDKIALLRKKATDEISQLKIMAEENRLAREIDSKKENRQIEQNRKKEMNFVRSELEKNFFNKQIESEIYINQLVERYENMLRDERRDFYRTLKTKLTVANDKNIRLAQDFETQKNNIIEQYEHKIEKMKQAYKMRSSNIS